MSRSKGRGGGGKILEDAAEALFAPFFPLSNIIIGVLGAVAYPRFPGFFALARAVLTLKRGMLTPGLPHAYPIPGVRLPRHGKRNVGRFSVLFT